MSWTFETIRGKLPAVLRTAGVALDDKAAEAVVTSVAALMPEGELFTHAENEGAFNTLKQEAKSAREASVALLEKVTGMRRDQFAEQDRHKLMFTAAEERLANLQRENETYKTQFDPMKAKLSKYEQAAEQAVKSAHGEVVKKLDAVFAVPEHKTKFAPKFKLPEAGKELTIEDMQHNVTTFNELVDLGVPAFKTDSQKPENTPPPRQGSGGGSANRFMTAKQLAEKRAAAGIH